MATTNPFPGMNPWLERLWDGDLHQSIITYVRDLLQPKLPDSLYAAIERTIYLLNTDTVEEYRPDVTVFDTDEPSGWQDTGGGSVATLAVAEPVTLTAKWLDRRHSHIEIRDADLKDRVVTVIELLSPTNKINSRGRQKYLRKRERYVRAEINVVEIDLLRAGPHTIAFPLNRMKPSMESAYRVCVTVAVDDQTARHEYYPAALRNRLPQFRIPLRLGETPVILDLQPPLNQAYENGRYVRRIDYALPPEPPLSDDDLAWARGLLQSHASGSAK